MTRSSPVGVFDSGVGGLSVLREIRSLLPGEDLIYVADSGFAPYGGRPESYISERATTATRFLVEQGAKAVVVACNTATAVAITRLRAEFSVPIVGMEPAVKPAAALSRTGIIGVLATAGTLASRTFDRLVTRFADGMQVVTQPCEGLVEQIERGDLASAQTRLLIERYTPPLMERGADTLILGCTHYPLVRSMIADVVGAQVALIDTGAAVARQLRNRLEQTQRLSQASGSGGEQFWTSATPVAVQAVMARLWGRDIAVRQLPQLQVATERLSRSL
jgi:glutamate racemase